MAYKSNLRPSWVLRALLIEWGWQRRGLDPARIRRVYQIYLDCKDLGYKDIYHKVVQRFNSGKKRHLRLDIKGARGMIRSYKNYMKAIGDGCDVKSEDCA